MKKPLGLDISKFQSFEDGTQLMDFDKIRKINQDPNADHVLFIIARSGVSYAYKDLRFDYNWAEIEKLGVHRGFYHVVYFGESVKDQMEWMLKIANPKLHDLPVLDLEVTHNLPKEKITEVTLACMEYLKNKLGRYPMLYSRASWVDVNMDLTNYPVIANADWWLAQYNLGIGTERQTAPILPKSVKKYKIHQTSDKMSGAKFGAKSTYIDTNRYNGTENELHDYFGEIIQLPTEPIPETEAVLFTAYVTASPYMNTRTGPGIEHPKLKPIYEHETVNVYKVITNDKKEIWWRIATDRWAVAAYLSTKELPEVSMQDATQLLVYPFEKRYSVTQKFGANNKPSDTLYNWYKATKGHNGIDFGVPANTAVYSPVMGVVTVAAELTYGYGHHLQIKSGDVTLLLGHATDLLVKQGDIVMPGEPLMLTGSTGASTGPHLHLETRSPKADRTLPGGALGAYNPYNDFIKDHRKYEL